MNSDYSTLASLVLEEQRQQLVDCENHLATETDFDTRAHYSSLHLQLSRNLAELEKALADKSLNLADFSHAIEESTIAITTGEYAARVTVTPEPGLVLADTYRLERVLGRGGMGEVWLATHLLLNEPRAIKLVLHNRANQPASLERFVQGEARQSLRLNHPHIVRVYDLAQHQQTPFIVMEYFGNEASSTDLKAWLKANGKMSFEQIADWLEQIAAGLEAAHRQGLVHCDLKPTNILINGGVAKITDFGLVKDLQAQDDQSNGKVMGTPRYMSPEQAQGKVSTASDIYSLGVILYELVTGRPPFVGNTMALFAQHAAIVPEFPHKLNAELPEAVSAVVLKALAKIPTERYATAPELAIAFRQALGLQTVTNNFSTVSQIPNNLPQPNNKLLGRERELAEVTALLEADNTRLVTLTGAGGTGKTRLALEIAQIVVSGQWSVGSKPEEAFALSSVLRSPFFQDGIFFINLENVIDSNSLVNELKATLGVKEGKAGAGKSGLELLKAYLTDKTLLLVLDNFEQLTDSATVLTELLEASGGLKFLVTSRVKLNLAQEQEYMVDTLTLPDSKSHNPAGLLKNAAVALLVERAQETKRGFTLNETNAADIEQLCIRLDGLPLALELAAARLKLLTPRQILERLRENFKLLSSQAVDLPPRQRTLHATIDWSYGLLEDSEKRLLARVAVFAGGFTVEAAEKVCNTDGDLEVEVLDGLESLTNKSLIKQYEGQDGQNRCRMLQTIREYALQKLVESGENYAIYKERANYFEGLLERLEPTMQGAKQQTTLKRLDTEYDNVRAVIDWSLEQGDGATAERVSTYLGRYWYLRGSFSEGRSYLERALALAAAISPLYRANTLQAVAQMALNQGDYVSSIAYYKQGLELCQKVEHKAGIAAILLNLGKIADNQADYNTAENYFKESLTLCREIDDKLNAGANLNNLGNITSNQGDYVQAQGYYQECLMVMRELGDKAYMASALQNLGNMAAYQGDYATTARYFEESLLLRREIGDALGIAHAVTNLGALAYVREDYPTALNYYLEGLQIRRDAGDKFGIAASLTNLGLLAYKQQDYSDGLKYFHESLRLKKELNDKYGIAVGLVGLAAIAVGLSGVTEGLGSKSNAAIFQWQRAAQLSGAVAAAMVSIGGNLQPSEQVLYDEVVKAAKAELSEAKFEELFQTGQAMTLQEAIAFALLK